MNSVAKDDIVQFLADNLFDGESVPFDENLIMSGRLDSLGVMTLVAFLEESVGTRIPAGDIVVEHFESVDSISAYLKTLDAA